MPERGNYRTMEKPSLLTDKNNYRQTLQKYYGCMLRSAPQGDWISHKFGVRIRDMFQRKRNINILAVGSGSGEFDLDLLDEIVRCGTEQKGPQGYNAVYTVVEPNASNVTFFRNTVERNPKYSRIQFQWSVETFDDFLNRFKRDRSNRSNVSLFDFVHFVRSFYHVNSVQAFDETYKHLLVKDGIMCGVGENAGFWPDVMQFFADHKIDHVAFTVAGRVSDNYFLPGWQRLARERNWKYESYAHGYDFDITPMFNPNSEDGDYLIDFVMHAKDVRKTFKSSTISDFFKFLDEGKVEKVNTKDGMMYKNIYYPCEFGAIMMTKE